MLLGFEHVGMTVSNMDRSLHFYCDLLGLKCVVDKTSKDGGRLAFVDAGGGMLEMAAPANGAHRNVDVQKGDSGLRHLTFRYSDIEETFAALEKAGAEIVERPRLAANREILHKVAFVRDPDGIIIELSERVPNHEG